MTNTTLAQSLWPAPQRDMALRRDLTLVTAFSLLTALSAQISIPLPFSPVPVTMQTFAVLLTGLLLGPRLGAASLVLYLLEGAAGLPFFHAGTGGAAVLAGPTGGYLMSYPLVAALVGGLAGRGWDKRPGLTLLAMLLGSAVIYLFGAATLSLFVGGLRHAFLLGVWPFLLGDALKALLAAGLLPLGWKLMGGRRG